MPPVERLRPFSCPLLPRLALAALMAVPLLAACGSNVIQGRPPFVGIASMSLQGDRLAADFRISNQNGVPMNVQSYELNVTVDDTSLLRESRDYALEIDANSAEELHVERTVDAATRQLLDELERQERPSLPFELKGRVRTAEDGYLRFEHKGHFYPVPGRPGHFRSAVTQARELRRPDDI